MNFQNLEIKNEYRSFSDNIVSDFYIPILEKSKIYKRAVGYFSSSALIEISKGITNLIKNNGTIKLVASPYLSDEDLDAIHKGYDERENILKKCIRKYLEEVCERKTVAFFRKNRCCCSSRKLGLSRRGV